MGSTGASLRRLGRAGVISRQAMSLGAAQSAHELHLAVDMLLTHKPEIIVEIGCDKGGTLFAWRQVCDRVYGITLEENADSGGAECQEHGASVLYGDSHSDEIYGQLRSMLGDDQVDVLVIDGDHRLTGIIADLEDYGPLVRDGGLIMLHDVLPECFSEVYVWKLWPVLEQRYQTELIWSPPPPGYAPMGWGVIHIRKGDKFFIGPIGTA